MFHQKYLTQNIRKYRLLRGLTQEQLAQALSVTSQNVSKWETGKSVPGLENLYTLSQVLHVSTDRLLGRAEVLPQGRVLAAIDGDGTKTEFILFTEFGKILEHFFLPGSDPTTTGLDNAQSVLKNGMEQLMAVSADICAVYAGIAGCSNADNRRVLRDCLRRLCPGIVCNVDPDVHNVINSTSISSRCIVAICRTSSVVFAKTPNSLQRVGGWGPLWESGCSAYDFGADAILAALKARDGLSEPTVLQQLVEDSLGGNIWEKIHALYTLPRNNIAAYAHLVFKAFALDDPTAARIIEKNTNQLAQLINTAARQYNCGTDVILSIGTFAQKDILADCLKPKLLPGLKLHLNTMPPICGAAVLCCKLLGEPAPDFTENFYKDYMQHQGG